MLKNVMNSYKSKCKELGNLHDEYNRYSIWFSEKLRASALELQQSNKKTAETEREIRELKRQLSEEQSKVQNNNASLPMHWFALIFSHFTDMHGEAGARTQETVGA
jgi:hypothetical protein